MENSARFRSITAAELLQKAERDRLERERHPRQHWESARAARKGGSTRFTAGVGQWTYDPEMLTIAYRDPEYELDLEELVSAAELLDTLYQVAGKSWIRPGDVEDLMALVDEVVEELFQTSVQGLFCPFGKPYTVTWPKAPGTGTDDC